MNHLDDKTALITDGGRGIGRAISLQLAQRGARVAVAARSEDELVGTTSAIAASPAMVERRWRDVVNVSSGIARAPAVMVGANADAATKAAIEAHTVNLAAELAGTGATVKAYRPGSVDTAMQAWSRDHDSDAIGRVLRDRFAERHAAGDLITPAASLAALAGHFGVVLLYRGGWYPYCNAQLRALRRDADQLAELDIRAVALSVDDEATTRQTIAEHRLDFPVGHSADADAIATTTGVFVNDEPRYLQSTGFVLEGEGRVIVSLYSSGAIGRPVPDEVIGLIKYVRGRGAHEEAA